MPFFKMQIKMQRKMRRISIIGINMSSSLFLRQSLQRGMNPQFDNGLTYQKTSEQNKTKKPRSGSLPFHRNLEIMLHSYLQMKKFATCKPVKALTQMQENLMTGKKTEGLRERRMYKGYLTTRTTSTRQTHLHLNTSCHSPCQLKEIQQLTKNLEAGFMDCEVNFYCPFSFRICGTRSLQGC